MDGVSRVSRRRCRGPALALSVLALGCAARTPITAPTLAERPLPPAAPQPYRLQVGDLIAIRFWGNPELDEEVTIRPDNRISLPFVDEVEAAGRTPAELDAELTRRYTGELARPEITVIVRQFSGQRVFIGGEVNNQGALPLTGPVTLLQAVQEAGGFRTSARRRQVLLIRTTPEGERIARSLDLRPVLSGAEPGADIALHPSDIIFVPRTKITNVNLFVQQYIDDLLPVQPLLTLPLYEEPLLGGDQPDGGGVP